MRPSDLASTRMHPKSRALTIGDDRVDFLRVRGRKIDQLVVYVHARLFTNPGREAGVILVHVLHLTAPVSSEGDAKRNSDRRAPRETMPQEEGLRRSRN